MVTNYWLGSYVDNILPLTSPLPTATGCTGGDNLYISTCIGLPTTTGCTGGDAYLLMVKISTYISTCISLPTATGCTGGDNLFSAWRAWKYSHTSSMVSSIFFKKDFYFDCFDSKFNLF